VAEDREALVGGFPGRHHLLTRFQADLERAVAVGVGECGPEDGDRVIWMELHGERESWERFVADRRPERVEYELREELVEHRFAPVATLRPAGERERALPWPDTHLRLVARRPAA